MGCGKTLYYVKSLSSLQYMQEKQNPRLTLQSSPPIYHLPFCPLLLVFLSLCGRISPDLFTYFLCVSCFFPLLVFLTLPCLCTFGLCVFVELTAAALPAHFRFIIYQHQFSWIFTSVFTRFFKSVNILVMQWPTYKFKNFLYWLRSSLCFSVPQVHYFLCFPHSSLCLLAATQLPHVPLSLPRASRNHQLPLIYTITHFLTTKHFHQV